MIQKNEQEKHKKRRGQRGECHNRWRRQGGREDVSMPKRESFYHISLSWFRRERREANAKEELGMSFYLLH